MCGPLSLAGLVSGGQRLILNARKVLYFALMRQRKRRSICLSAGKIQHKLRVNAKIKEQRLARNKFGFRIASEKRKV